MAQNPHQRNPQSSTAEQRARNPASATVSPGKRARVARRYGGAQLQRKTTPRPAGSGGHYSGSQVDTFLDASPVLRTYIRQRFKDGKKADGYVHVHSNAAFRNAYWKTRQGRKNKATGQNWTQAEANAHADGIRGFYSRGETHIHRTRAAADTIIHEAVHLYAQRSFKWRCGRSANEGATTFFTNCIDREQGITPGGSYPTQTREIEHLVSLTSVDALALGYFGGDMDNLDLMIDFKFGIGTFDKWCRHMKADEYRKARQVLR